MFESIKMLERRFNLFPAKFSWRGRIYRVDAVNECQTVISPLTNHTTHHFWVRCDGQLWHLCEILPTSCYIEIREEMQR